MKDKIFAQLFSRAKKEGIDPSLIKAAFTYHYGNIRKEKYNQMEKINKPLISIQYQPDKSIGNVDCYLIKVIDRTPTYKEILRMIVRQQKGN